MTDEKKPKATMRPEQIPEMLQQLLPVWQTAIDGFQEQQAANQLSREDLKVSMQLAAALTTTYVSFRVWKSEIRAELAREATGLPQAPIMVRPGPKQLPSPFLSRIAPAAEAEASAVAALPQRAQEGRDPS